MTDKAAAISDEELERLATNGKIGVCCDRFTEISATILSLLSRVREAERQALSYRFYKSVKGFDHATNCSIWGDDGNGNLNGTSTGAQGIHRSAQLQLRIDSSRGRT